MGDRVNISKVAELLNLRAAERFTDKNLAPRLQETLKDLVQIAKQSEDHKNLFIKSHFLLVALKIILLILGLAIIYLTKDFIFEAFSTENKGQLIQIIESAANLVLVLGATIISFLTFDKSLRRQRVRGRTASIRSIINTIALLQLEKDPARLLRSSNENTEHSPQLSFNAFELDCYFEYSIEALEICSAILSSYAKVLDDGILLNEISELQELASAKEEMISRRRERLVSIKNN